MQQRLAEIKERIKAEAARHDEILVNVHKGVVRPEDLPNIHKLLDGIRLHIEKMRTDENVGFEEIVRRTAQLMKSSQDVSFEYGIKLIEVNLSIRRELGLPLDEDKYRNLVRQSLDRNRKAIDKFRDSLYSSVLQIDSEPEAKL
jgi:hypothetical protein